MRLIGHLDNDKDARTFGDFLYVQQIETEFEREGNQWAVWVKADDRNSFELRAHMGSHALFITGVFPDRIRVRAERRGFPDLRYFEGVGQSSFRVASDHRLAARYDLAKVFDTLSERFSTARRALNDLSERLLTFDDDRHALPLLTSAKLIS